MRLASNPEVCHLNEGHAAFAVLERARCFMQKTAQPFNVALAVTRAGNYLYYPYRSGGGIRPVRSESYQTIPLPLCRAKARHNNATSYWLWAVRTRTMIRKISIWPIWPSAAAEQSMA